MVGFLAAGQASLELVDAELELLVRLAETTLDVLLEAAVVDEGVTRTVALPNCPAAAAQGVVSAFTPPTCDHSSGSATDSY